MKWKEEIFDFRNNRKWALMRSRDEVRNRWKYYFDDLNLEVNELSGKGGSVEWKKEGS